MGLFLSGGIDSSLVAALAAKATGRQIQSYTIGFTDADYDEAPFAEKIAVSLGIENHRRVIHEDVLQYAREIARQYDEPFGDSSAVPTWFVSKLARQDITVALTGDGGDEAFAGYDFMMQAVRIWGDGEQRLAFMRPMTPSEHLWEWKLRIAGFRRGYSSLGDAFLCGGDDSCSSRLSCGAIAWTRPLRIVGSWYEQVRSADWMSRMQYPHV